MRGFHEVFHSFHGRGTAPLKSDFVAEQVACAQSILEGTCAEKPYKSFAGDALLCSYKSASIAYDPKNLRVR